MALGADALGRRNETLEGLEQPAWLSELIVEAARSTTNLGSWIRKQPLKSLNSQPFFGGDDDSYNMWFF